MAVLLILLTNKDGLANSTRPIDMTLLRQMTLYLSGTTRLFATWHKCGVVRQ